MCIRLSKVTINFTVSRTFRKFHSIFWKIVLLLQDSLFKFGSLRLNSGPRYTKKCKLRILPSR